MKQKQIFIIVGVIVLILIIANWDKLFPKKKYSRGGVVVINDPFEDEMAYFPNYNQITLWRLSRGINTMGGPGYWYRDK